MAASQGTEEPNAMLVPGSTLNEQLQVTIYEPHAMYLVTIDDIVRVEE